MGIEFALPSRLDQMFSAKGHFYDLTEPGGSVLPCRSVLEIRHEGAAHELPDAIVVMMNPGSSRPIETIHATSTLSSDQPSSLVDAHPDTTQYQIMRVMLHKGWTLVRVLNLSDLRDTNSREFAKFVVASERSKFHSHSIFCADRKPELLRHLSRKQDAPIICAWGVSSDLNPLIDRAFAGLEEQGRIVGIEKEGDRGKYYHPLGRPQPRQVQWLADMVSRLAIMSL